MTEKMRNSLRFVTRFYSPGALRPDDSFITEGLPFWKRHAVAASVIGVTIIAAAAVSTYLALSTPQPHTEKEKTETPAIPAVETPNTDTVKEMKFEDTPLPEVVKAIEEAYGVKVTGTTEGQPALTLSYKGTAEDLVAAINDLLGTNLKIDSLKTER